MFERFFLIWRNKIAWIMILFYFYWMWNMLYYIILYNTHTTHTDRYTSPLQTFPFRIIKVLISGTNVNSMILQRKMKKSKDFKILTGKQEKQKEKEIKCSRDAIYLTSEIISPALLILPMLSRNLKVIRKYCGLYLFIHKPYWFSMRRRVQMSMKYSHYNTVTNNWDVDREKSTKSHFHKH